MSKIIFTGLFQKRGGGLWLHSFCENLACLLSSKGYNIDFIDLSPTEKIIKLPNGCTHTYINNKFFPPWNIPKINENTDELIWSDSYPADYIKIFIGMLFSVIRLKNLISKNNIPLIIYHNGTISIQRIFKYFAKSYGLPQLFIQAGILPGTLEIDQNGTQALGWSVQNPDLFNELTITNNDIKNANNYLNFIKEKNKTIGLKKFDSIESIKSLLSENKKPVIFFAGSGKYGNGIWPRFYPESYIHSPFFADDLQVLPLLLRIAKKNNWYILYKPHPENPKKKLKKHPNLLIVEDLNRENIISCLLISNIVITLVSSVSALALMYEKPVVLLGRNALTRKNILYELKSKEGLDILLKTALDYGFTDKSKNNWIQFVARTLKYNSFAYDKEIEKFTGNGIEKASNFILKYCIGSKN